MNKTTRFISMISVLAVCACSTPKPGTPEAFAYEKKQAKEQRQELVKDIIKQTPDWFISVPKDDISIYSAGSAASSDLQTASDLALMNAKTSLADRLKSAFSAKIKSMIQETGDDEQTVVSKNFVKAMENLIPEADLTGYEKAKYKIIPQGTKYRAFVLLRYPLNEANKILVDRIKKENILQSKVKASKEYKELKESVEKYKKEQ